MAPEERLLPLFPLNTVLFPGGTIPLQIFEERYKLMMQHCLDADSKFGVVLIRSGSEVGSPAVPHSVGTVAHIVQVNRAEDGRMFISVVGQQRFRIKEVTQSQPYMAAQVDLLDEDVNIRLTEEEMETIRQTVTQHVRLTLGLAGGWVREPAVPIDPLVLSYFIPRILQAELPLKQKLLEADSTLDRLDAELDMLTSEADALKVGVARQLKRKFGWQ